MYAHRAETREHGVARALIERLATSEEPWAIPWPCVYEFLRVVTHSRVFYPPTPLDEVLPYLRTLLASPTLQRLTETERHADVMAQVLTESPVVGSLMHDVHIAALLREYGVSELLTADGDFARFQGFRVTNPFR